MTEPAAALHPGGLECDGTPDKPHDDEHKDRHHSREISAPTLRSCIFERVQWMRVFVLFGLVVVLLDQVAGCSSGCFGDGCGGCSGCLYDGSPSVLDGSMGDGTMNAQ